MEIIELFLQNLSSPPILFFILGITVGLLKSDLNVPDQISHYLAIYLMMAIGFIGLLVSRQVSHLKEFNLRLISFVIYMPLVSAAIGLLTASKSRHLYSDVASDNLPLQHCIRYPTLLCNG